MGVRLPEVLLAACWDIEWCYRMEQLVHSCSPACVLTLHSGQTLHGSALCRHWRAFIVTGGVCCRACSKLWRPILLCVCQPCLRLETQMTVQARPHYWLRMYDCCGKVRTIRL